MAMRFIPNAERSRRNLRRHGISFEEAASSFADPRAVVFQDDEYSTPDHSRMISIAVSNRARILVVLYYVDVFGRIEIIQARKARQKEWARYADR